MAEDLDRSLEQLTATIQEQNKELKRKDSLNELDASITALEKSSTENSAQLRQTLTNIQMALDSASTAEQMELAEEQLEALKDLAGTEEENREAARRQEEANEFLSKIVSGIDGLADSYDKQLDALKPSAGLVAGLGALSLLFMDPETLFAGVQAAIDGVFAIVDSIKMFLEGDFTEGFALLGDNIGAVAGILGTLGILFGGTIIRAFGGIFKGIQLVIRGVQLFRLFMLGTFVPSMIGFFSTISAAVAPILIAAAPFIAIGALVAAGVYAIYEAFKTAKDVFDETGSITETMVTFATDIVTAPLRWIKDLSAWVLSKLGFEELATKLNNFDITKTITDTVMGTIDWIKGIFTDPVAALEKLAVALLGVDGLLGIITAPIDKAIAWVQGLFNLGDPSRPFSLYDTLYTPIDKTITWLQGLFADPKAKLQEAWNGLVGEGGLIDILYTPVEKAITWIKGLFTWASDGLAAGWTNLTDFISGKWTQVKTWFTDLWAWASEGISQGWTNLTDFISGKWAEVKTWFTEKLTWASDGLAAGWTNVTDFVSSKWNEVHTWFTGLFTWASDGIAAGWTNLTDFISGKWTATKKWFTDMFTWSSKEDDKGVIQQLFDSTIEKVKSFFTDLFDFLPSFEDIKKSITGMLPDFLQPDSIEEQKAEIQNEIAEHQAQIAEGDMRYGAANVLSRENRVTELQQALSELEGLNKGGIVNAPATGGLAMLHGAEIVAPLNSPQGKVLMAINDLMNAKSAAGAGEYSGMGGPMIVQGGSNQTSNNTNNVSNSNYTIQQGITPDDFLKRDFLNFSY
jgi:hypothetical protein